MRRSMTTPLPWVGSSKTSVFIMLKNDLAFLTKLRTLMNFSQVYAKCGLLLDYLSTSQTCKFCTFCPAHNLSLQFSWEFLGKLNLLRYELYKSQPRSELVFEIVSHSGRVQFSWHRADPVCNPRNRPSNLVVCFQLKKIAVNPNQWRLTLTH